MKSIHFLSIASVLVTFALASGGYPKLASLPIALVTVVQIVAAALLGKQSNEGQD